MAPVRAKRVLMGAVFTAASCKTRTGLIDRLTFATAVTVGNVYADGSAVTFSKGG